MKLHVYTDGSITGGAWGKKDEKGTTPHGWSGWVIKREDGIVIQHHSLDLGAKKYMSGNVAEYMALRSALAWLVENKITMPLEIFADSQLIIHQMDGSYHVHDGNLKILHDECAKLAYNFPSVNYNWIRREQNKEADVLSKGYQLWGRVPTWDEVQDTLRKGWK